MDDGYCVPSLHVNKLIFPFLLTAWTFSPPLRPVFGLESGLQLLASQTLPYQKLRLHKHRSQAPAATPPAWLPNQARPGRVTDHLRLLTQNLGDPAPTLTEPSAPTVLTQLLWTTGWNPTGEHTGKWQMNRMKRGRSPPVAQTRAWPPSVLPARRHSPNARCTSETRDNRTRDQKYGHPQFQPLHSTNTRSPRSERRKDLRGSDHSRLLPVILFNESLSLHTLLLLVGRYSCALPVVEVNLASTYYGSSAGFCSFRKWHGSTHNPANDRRPPSKCISSIQTGFSGRNRLLPQLPSPPFLWLSIFWLFPYTLFRTVWTLQNVYFVFAGG